MPPKPIPISERFWQRVDSSGGPDSCWPWTGARDPNGYGRVSVNGRCRLTHRVAFLLTFKRVPKWGALHACDNPPCCNPRHLFDGDQAANMADAAIKGRVAKGDGHPARLKPEAFQKKLTLTQVEVALRRIAAGERRCDVARSLGVTPEAIGHYLAKQRRQANG